jgi:hypothetical protein
MENEVVDIRRIGSKPNAVCIENGNRAKETHVMIREPWRQWKIAKEKTKESKRKIERPQIPQSS